MRHLLSQWLFAAFLVSAVSSLAGTAVERVAATASDAVTESQAGPNAPVEPPAESEEVPPEPTVADPVGVFSGSVEDSAVDAVVRCPGVDLVFQRSYRGLSLDSGALGPCWTHSYEWRIVSLPDGRLQLRAMADPSQSVGGGYVAVFDPPPATGESVSPYGPCFLSRDSAGLYALRTPGGLRYRFRADGRLDSIEAVGGETVTLSYDASDRLVRIAHSNGKGLALEYEGDDPRLRVLRTPDHGVYVEYAYDGECGMLASAVRHDGASSASLAYRYTRAASSHDAGTGGPRPPLLSAPIAEPGDAERVRFSAGGGARLFSPFTGDGETAATPPSEPASDAFPWMLSSRTDANGVSARYGYVRYTDAPAPRCNVTAMDGDRFRTTFHYENGSTAMDALVDGRPVRTVYRYTADRLPTSIQTGTAQTQFQHDGLRNPVRIASADSATGASEVSVADYGPWHNPTNLGYALRGEPTAWHRLGWDADWLLPNRVETPEGRLAEWSRAPGRIDVHAAGAASPLGHSAALCDAAWHPHTLLDANGAATALSYDASGGLSRIAPFLGPAADLEYDLLGNLSALTLPGPGAEPRRFTMENNARGLPTRVVRPDGIEETVRYNGAGTRPVETVDALGRTNVYEWVLGYPVLAQRLTPDHPQGIPLFSASYDSQMNVLSITDPAGRAAESYVLDDLGRVVAVTNLEGQVLSASYLLGDRLTRLVRFDGTEVSLDYDTDGNAVSLVCPGETVGLSYDRDGLLLAATNALGAVSFAYNEAGWATNSVGVDGSAVSYAYHPAGQVSGVVSVAGTTAYALDAASRLASIAAPVDTFAFGYCGWNGLVDSTTSGHGPRIEYGYDLLDRPTSIVYRASGGAVLASFGYAYNPVGQITNRMVAVGASSLSIGYGYDVLDRLVSEAESAETVRAYAYDAAGNRIRKQETGHANIAYTLGAGDRLASWTGGGAYAHDAAGCVTRIEGAGKPVRTLAWDGLYRLAAVSTNGVAAESYTWDALGRRASTTTAEGTVRHVYDGIHCIADIDADGALLRTYVWGPSVDNLLAMTVHAGGSSETYYALADLQGTVHGFADAAGALAARYAYDAWGDLLAVETSVPALASNRYLFQGREYSHSTGLYNFRARWYDPETGRWLSKDPIGLAGGLNLYAFCGNKPDQKRDPWGLSVRNNSEYDVYVKPESGIKTSGAFLVSPGKIWSGEQDGIAIQGLYDNMVFKVPGKGVIKFDLVVNPDGSIVQTPANWFTKKLIDCENEKGEWKDLDFLDQLHRKKRVVPVFDYPNYIMYPCANPVYPYLHNEQSFPIYRFEKIPDPDTTWDNLFRCVNPQKYKK